MKHRIVAVCILVIFALTSAAIAAPKSQSKAGAGALAGVVKQLDLSKEQVKQIGDILKEYHANVREVFQSTTDPAQKKDKVQALRTKAASAINAVLTAEQRAKADKMNLIEKLLSRRAAVGRGLIAVLSQLNLTEDQKAQVKEITKETAEDAKAIRNDSSLTDEQRREKMKELHAGMVERIKSILTAEQREKLESILEKKPGSDRPGRWNND